MFSCRSTATGCPAGTIRLTGYSPSCSILFKYGTGHAPGDSSSNGKTLGQHEMGHATIFIDMAQAVDAEIARFMDMWVCPPCLSAMTNYLKNVVVYANVALRYQNTAYDCAEHDPGPNKTVFCAKADLYHTVLTIFEDYGLEPAKEAYNQACR